MLKWLRQEEKETLKKGELNENDTFELLTFLFSFCYAYVVECVCHPSAPNDFAFIKVFMNELCHSIKNML